MTPTGIRITLKSAGTFGRGDGVPGLVDREIEHDKDGFPYLRGKTLKGLLAESAENVVFALEDLQKKSGWGTIKNELFGVPGRGEKEDRGILHIGDAQLDIELRAEVNRQEPKWSKEEVLFSLTGIRRQTTMNVDGGPDHASLRAMRVLLPGVTLEAQIQFDKKPEPQHLQLLTAAVLDFRRAGTGRNRGRGWLTAELIEEGKTMQDLFNEFEEAI